MSAQVKDFISQCSICNQLLPKQQKRNLMIIYEVPNRPWNIVGIHLLNFNSKDYVIMVNYYSNFWKIKELITCAAIVKFCKEQFAKCGIVDMLISDNGPRFLCAEF